MSEKWRIGQLGFGLFLVSSAINSQGYIEIAVLRTIADEGETGISGNSGYYSLAINNFSSALITLILPFFIKKLKAKWCMSLGAFCQSIYLFGFLKLSPFSLYFLSSLLGIGGAFLWTSNGNFLVLNSSEENLSRNSCLMWSLYQGSQLSCALFLFILLLNKDLISSYRLAYSIFGSICLFGAITFAFLPENRILLRNEQEVEENNAIKITFSLLKTKKMRYLLVIFLFIGIETSFLSSIYTSCLLATTKLNDGKEISIAYSVFFIGIGEIFGGLLFGIDLKILKNFGKKHVISVGSLSILFAYLFTFINLPNDSPIHKTNSTGLIEPRFDLALFTSFLIGFGDSCWQTQVFPLIGSIFHGDSITSAFSLQQFFLTLSSTFPFYYGSILRLHWQLIIGGMITLISTLIFNEAGWLDTGHGYSVPVIVKILDPLTVSSVVSGQKMIVEEPSRLSLRKESNIHVQDILELSESSESHVLYALQERFRNRRIYTSLGNDLVFINPNEHLPIYDHSVINQIFKNKNDKGHIFATVRDIIARIREGSIDETIIFRGETGSGKSFNSFQAMRAAVKNAPSKSGKITEDHVEALHQIFHSFATARTSKNPISTRFGYSIDFNFKDNNIEGFSVKIVSPLEVSRIVSLRSNERNFNVFYELLSGLPENLREQFGFRDQQKFFYLTKGIGESIDSSDGSNFVKLEKSLETLGFSEDQRTFIYRLLASILHLGNIYFRQRKLPDGGDGVEFGSEREISLTSRLLEVNEQKWGSHFVNRFLKTENGIQSMSLNIEQALDTRDSIAQLLYEELFAWILGRISQNYKCLNAQGILRFIDMYGFERYASNGLHQLFINTFSEIDNGNVVEMLMKKPSGLLPLLDDECKFPKATDETYLQHTNLNHLDKSIYGKSRNKDKCEFSVRHYGGTVWYSVIDYIRSNRRAVPMGILNAFGFSHNQIIQQIFRPLCGREFGDFIQYSGQQHVRSMQLLFEQLNNSTIHFVSCVRGNAERIVAKFDLPTVSRQLRCLAVLDTTRFRVSNFPIRFEYSNFARRFRCLLPGMISIHQKIKEIINDVLLGQGFSFQQHYKIGSTLVFLSDRLANRLEMKREDVIDEAVIVLQKTIRGLIARREYRKKRKASIRIQAAFRGWKERKKYLEKLETRNRTLTQEARKNKRLLAYHEMIHGEIMMKNELSLGPIDHLDLGEEVMRTLESGLEGKKKETRTLHHYLSTPQQFIKPLISPITIEEFAEKNFKGHLLEVRRSPITTPFLMKICEADFSLSLSMFKLILKYSNDPNLSTEKLHQLAKFIIQMAISNIHLRDELFVQLSNQTYQNRNRENRERVWSLMLCALNSFPPSINVLAMLLGYFSTQSDPLKNSLMESLLRKLKTTNPTASRNYASNKLEQLSFTSRQTMAVQVDLPGIGDSFLVEAQPWTTTNELAARVLKEKGISNSNGWTVAIEIDDSIYAPMSGDFFHDVICEIEGVNSDRSIFYKYSNIGLGQNQQKVLTNGEMNRTKSSPVEKRRERILSAQQRDTSTDESSGSPRSQEEIGKEIYSYAMPWKGEMKQRSVSEDPRGVSRESMTRDERRNEYDTIRDHRPGSRAPSQNTLRRYHDSQQTFAQSQPMIQPIYVPQTTMQYMPMMPVMMTTNGMNQQMIQPIYGNITVQREPWHARDLSKDSLIDDRSDQIQQTPASSRLTERATSCDRVPSEYSNLSVASRIRRIPVPRENGDVDRFLDEVFQQVIPPDYDQRKISNVTIAASIKGGVNGLKANPPESNGYGSSDAYDYVQRNDINQENNHYSDGNPKYYQIYENDFKMNGDNEEVYGMARGRQRNLSSRQSNVTLQEQKRERHKSQPSRNVYKQNYNQQPMYVMVPMQMGQNGQPVIPQMMMCMPSAVTSPQMIGHVPSSRLSSYDYEDESDSPIGDMDPQRGFQQFVRQNRQGEQSMRAQLASRDALSPSYDTENGPKKGLSRIPTEMYRVVQNQVSNSEHPIPHKLPLTGMQFTQERAKKEREALTKLVEAAKHLPPPVDSIRLFRPPKRQQVEEVQEDEIPEEPQVEWQPPPPPPKEYIHNGSVQRSNPRLLQNSSEISLQSPQIPPITPPNGINGYQPQRQVPVFLPDQPLPIRQNPALTYVKQPWKLTIRKEMFYPGERLDDPQMISQAILKENRVPPELLGRQDEIPIGVKARVVESARKWPLYFAQIHEVVETRSNENIYLLLGLSETGIRLLVQNPLNKENPLKIQDHFEFGDVLSVESGVEKLILNTRNGMKVSLKTQKADFVRAQIERCLKGKIKEKVFKRAAADYITKEPNLLSFVKGDVIEIIEVDDDDEKPARGWLYGRIGNRYGHLPEDYVSELDAVMDVTPMSPIVSEIAEPQPQPPPLPIDDMSSARPLKIQTARQQKGFFGQRREQADESPRSIGYPPRDSYREAPRDPRYRYDGRELQPVTGPRDFIGGAQSGGGYSRSYQSYHQSHQSGGGGLSSSGRRALTDINDYNFEDAYEMGSIGNDKHTMMEFALMYYRNAKGGDSQERGRRNFKEWTWRDVADKVKWTDRQIQQSLIRIENYEANKLAMEAFGCIMRYMGDIELKKGETKTDCVYRLLLICQKHEAMKDEVYCQVIRQTTSNRSNRPDSLTLGWRLFIVLTAYFTCSDGMWPYLTKYIMDTANDSRRACHGTAQICLQNLLKTKKYGGRKFLLSGAELEQITMYGNSLKRQQYLLPGGNAKLVNTRIVTVIEEVLQELCNDLNIRSPAEQQEFCLCVAVKNEPNLIFTANDEYVLDICTEMEHKNKSFDFLLRRAVWIYPLRLDNMMYIDVMFNQLLGDYLDGLFCSHMPSGQLSATSMDDVAKMGAYLYLSSQQKGQSHINPKNVYSLVPSTVIDRSVGPDQWASRVQYKMSNIDSMIDQTTARMHFLQILDKWPLFGASTFRVIRSNRAETKDEFILSIQRRGVQLLRPHVNSVFEEWPFSQVLSTNKYEKDRETMLDLKLGTLKEHKNITLQTNQAVDIIRLLGQYIYVDSQKRASS
ncbi:unnamed protein product, partial [Mesorhabditis belari]|uniref:Uncharacterized protein n=1 Tax=Mesorhabditis belari TaxID=2138241 RepID=A0AAF3EEC4_9BILA